LFVVQQIKQQKKLFKKQKEKRFKYYLFTKPWYFESLGQTKGRQAICALF